MSGEFDCSPCAFAKLAADAFARKLPSRCCTCTGYEDLEPSVLAERHVRRRPPASLDGNIVHQRPVVFGINAGKDKNLRECRSMNTGTRLWRARFPSASTATATAMAERSRRTKGNADKLSEYKRIRDGGSRKWKVCISCLVLDRVLTRQSA